MRQAIVTMLGVALLATLAAPAGAEMDYSWQAGGGYDKWKFDPGRKRLNFNSDVHLVAGFYDSNPIVPAEILFCGGVLFTPESSNTRWARLRINPFLSGQFVSGIDFFEEFARRNSKPMTIDPSLFIGDFDEKYPDFNMRIEGAYERWERSKSGRSVADITRDTHVGLFLQAFFREKGKYFGGDLRVNMCDVRTWDGSGYDATAAEAEFVRDLVERSLFEFRRSLRAGERAER